MTGDANRRRPTRALISVSDKTGLVEFSSFLEGHGVEILSTGGTARALRDSGTRVVDVSDYTGFPEIMDGRVKTLHPSIHGGILALRNNATHGQQMEDHGILPIDMVVVNLYRFEETVAVSGGMDECIEAIDIGGPALLRAAAKNHNSVVVVTDASDYQAVMNEMSENCGTTGAALRQRLALVAFGRTAAYDAAISRWFSDISGEGAPRRFVVPGFLRQTLRYGENPHQKGALYISGEQRPGVATASQIQGRELSYNNLNDADAAFELVAEFDQPAAVIVKHASPCGVAIGKAPADAFGKALSCDPESAFGGVAALNRPLDADFVAAMGKLFLEVAIAPSVTREAREALSSRQTMRLLTTEGLPDPEDSTSLVRQLSGGFLVQDRDTGRPEAEDLRTVTTREPTPEEFADLLFAMTVVKHVRSNAIVYAGGGSTFGIGAGQTSRVGAARIAAAKARENAAGGTMVAASDAFFPFPDGLAAVVEAGVSAVIQPGGSVRDNEVIAAANDLDIAMVFTGMRHFRH